MSYHDKLMHPSLSGPDHGWKDRHRRALWSVHNPHQLLGATKLLIRGWALYADAHRERYGSGIGDDGVLGPEWAKMGEAIRGLLNGDIGSLDAGTLDAFIGETLRAEGFHES